MLAYFFCRLIPLFVIVVKPGEIAAAAATEAEAAAAIVAEAAASKLELSLPTVFSDFS